MTAADNQIEAFLVAATAALYADPGLEPTIEIRDHDRLMVEIDIGGRSPGILIGKGASMRFALQGILGAFSDRQPEGVAISIRGDSDNHQRLPTLDQGTPDPAPVLAVCRACCELLGGSCSAEATESGVLAVVTVPEAVKNQVRPALLRIVRAVGKAHGFPAMAHVSSG